MTGIDIKKARKKRLERIINNLMQKPIKNKKLINKYQREKRQIEKRISDLTKIENRKKFKGKRGRKGDTGGRHIYSKWKPR